MLIEKTTRDLKLEIKEGLDTLLKEYKKDSLGNIEYIINSSMSYDKAIEMLQNTHNRCFGEMLGATYMFIKMLDEDTRMEIEGYIDVLRTSISVDFNIAYCKYINRLDEIYKNK